MRFETARSKSVIMIEVITIVNKVLPTNEIKPKMVALHEGDLFRKTQGVTTCIPDAVKETPVSTIDEVIQMVLMGDTPGRS